MQRRVRPAAAFALALSASLLAASPVPFWGAKDVFARRHGPGEAEAGRFHLGRGGRAGRAARDRRQPAGADRAGLPQRHPDRRREGLDGKARPPHADRHLHDPQQGQGPPVQDLRQRADALFRAADVGRHRPARRRGSGLSRVARLRAPADAVRRAALRDHERGNDGRHRERRERARRRRASGLPLAGRSEGDSGDAQPRLPEGAPVALAARASRRRARSRSSSARPTGGSSSCATASRSAGRPSRSRRRKSLSGRRRTCSSPFPRSAANPDTPGGTRWIGIALPGSGVGAGAPMDLKDAVPRRRAAAVRGRGAEDPDAGSDALRDRRCRAPNRRPGPKLNVLNSDPPAAKS